MNRLIIVLMTIAVLTGCAKEAYYVDQEWGKAQMASWDKIIANPADKYDGDNPTGMEGINSEEVMGVYNQGFSKKTEAPPVFELGVTEDSSN